LEGLASGVRSSLKKPPSSSFSRRLARSQAPHGRRRRLASRASGRILERSADFARSRSARVASSSSTGVQTLRAKLARSTCKSALASRPIVTVTIARTSLAPGVDLSCSNCSVDRADDVCEETEHRPGGISVGDQCCHLVDHSAETVSGPGGSYSAMCRNGAPPAAAPRGISRRSCGRTRRSAATVSQLVCDGCQRRRTHSHRVRVTVTA